MTNIDWRCQRAIVMAQGLPRRAKKGHNEWLSPRFGVDGSTRVLFDEFISAIRHVFIFLLAGLVAETLMILFYI